VDERLEGGTMNAVVRVGDTVHRAAGPWTPAVHELLRHVRTCGVLGVPMPHGVDQDGKEILEFVPGEVPGYPMPSWVWSDELIHAAATWLRGFHDATTGLVPSPKRWRLPDHPPIEVICHNDFAPYNMVFDRDHRFAGVIDFDTCSPGSRVWDVAYLAYRLVPFHAAGTPESPGTDAATQMRRLAALCESYGPPLSPDGVMAAILARVRDLHLFTVARAAEAGSASELHQHVKSYEADLAYIEELVTGQ